MVVKQLKKQKKICHKKTSQNPDILVIIIKENSAIISCFLPHNFHNLLSCSTFTTAMKYADVKLIYKKDNKVDKENHWPISILLNLSKVYERIMYSQICSYLKTKFSKFQSGFRKGFNAQHCLLLMIKKWRKVLDNSGETGAPFQSI